MKPLFFLAFLLIMAALPLPAHARDTESGVKITKNEAEHIALQRHRGARVSSARLATVDGRKVWLIEISPQKGDPISQVSVDATSGRIVSDQKVHR